MNQQRPAAMSPSPETPDPPLWRELCSAIALLVLALAWAAGVAFGACMLTVVCVYRTFGTKA